MLKKYLFAALVLLCALPVQAQKVIRVGMIGLDTSHSTAFTKLLNDSNAAPDLAGFKVVAAYPYGSRDIESSVTRIAGYTEEMKKMDVEIVGSIKELLDRVDVVLLETNDGRLHLEQALEVFKTRKPMFIDKPVAASLADAVAIYDAAARYKSPVWSASSLRYMAKAQEVRSGALGKVLGAEAYSPATLEKTHPDLFWYGVHGVEILYTVMGTGCESVTRATTPGSDVVVGTWKDGRIGTFRGMRDGKKGYGGRVFGDKNIIDLGEYDGYRGLVVEIATFFRTGIAPVSPEETIELFAFMEAADESKRLGGVPVKLETVLAKARKEATNGK